MVGISSVPDIAVAIGQGVAVMMAMMIGSAIGEEIASLFFGRVKGGLTQIIYLLFYMPLFIMGGYVYTLSGIPMTSVVTSGLFFGLWGIATVIISRLMIAVINRIFGIRFTAQKKFYVNGKDLIRDMKDKGLAENEIRNVLISSCDSPKKAKRLFEGGSEWVNVDPEALCYSLAKRGYNVHEAMKVLTNILKMRPEDAAVVWKNSSV